MIHVIKYGLMAVFGFFIYLYLDCVFDPARVDDHYQAAFWAFVCVAAFSKAWDIDTDKFKS